ncbi:unnamed protein product [Protopolystoma xenopodis]|uniref:C2CD5 C-terminal domain-containing protein n=1 Tax=Protopolystoma xenopodis TaxID=117903 RepID=A0A448WUH0_9PLAT|nr:unnamed protein product [Protopolystoma xenopodis]
MSCPLVDLSSNKRFFSSGDSRLSAVSSQMSCLLTPLSAVPGTLIDVYLGNLDFFFIRETTDVREFGGIGGFIHASLTEAQAVVGAHTTSLGGNALLSYRLSELDVIHQTSRNQAQCLLNVCGDMAYLVSLDGLA